MGSPFKTIIGGVSPLSQVKGEKVDVPKRTDISTLSESGVQGKTEIKQGPDINERIVNAITNFIVPGSGSEAAALTAAGPVLGSVAKVPWVRKLISKVFKSGGAKVAVPGAVKGGVGGARTKNLGFDFAKKSKTQHFKQFSKRTHAVRGGKVFDEGLAEYNSISSMHKLYPNRVAKPLNVVTDDTGKILGYNMEKVKGVTLYEKNKLSKKAYDEIAKTIKDMNSKGIYHGDLHARNIIIDKSGNWKLIDPVGYQHASHMSKSVLADAASRDIKSLQELKRYVE